MGQKLARRGYARVVFGGDIKSTRNNPEKPNRWRSRNKISFDLTQSEARSLGHPPPMAIYRMLKETAFDAETVEAMGRAYEDLLRDLRLADRNDPFTEIVAEGDRKGGEPGRP